MSDKVLLATEVLDKTWNTWLEQQQLTSYEMQWVLGRPYGSSYRRTTSMMRFETWLFSHGGSIRRVNKQYYIEFTDPKQASFFLLRNG